LCRKRWKVALAMAIWGENGVSGSTASKLPGNLKQSDGQVFKKAGEKTQFTATPHLRMWMAGDFGGGI